MKKIKVSDKAVTIAEVKPVNAFAITPLSFKESERVVVPTVRQSGHFVDQKLKYNDPIKNKNQPSLFDSLSPELEGVVEKSGIKYEGIRPTQAEDRLINAIFRLLHEKSENKNVDSAQFYKGNYHDDQSLVEFGKEKVKPAMLRIIPAELYKAYLDSDNYSGRDIADITTTLNTLANKKYLITYERTRRVKSGKTTEERIDRVMEAQSLFRILHYVKDMTQEEVNRLDNGDRKVAQEKGELIIALNPILTDQINSKYIEYPQNINKRTIIASGGHPNDVTKAIITLRDWALRELSSKHYSFEINAERLPYMLKLDNYVKQGRKKLIKETIEKAIQACKSLNLILEVKEAKGAGGQTKYVFDLNRDFNKDSQ